MIAKCLQVLNANVKLLSMAFTEFKTPSIKKCKIPVAGVIRIGFLCTIHSFVKIPFYRWYAGQSNLFHVTYSQYFIFGLVSRLCRTCL